MTPSLLSRNGLTGVGSRPTLRVCESSVTMESELGKLGCFSQSPSVPLVLAYVSLVVRSRRGLIETTGAPLEHSPRLLLTATTQSQLVARSFQALALSQRQVRQQRPLLALTAHHSQGHKYQCEVLEQVDSGTDSRKTTNPAARRAETSCGLCSRDTKNGHTRAGCTRKGHFSCARKRHAATKNGGADCTQKRALN